MDTDRIRHLLPHYVAMLIAVFVVLEVIRRAVGDIGFWAEFVIIAIVVFAYRPVVVRLGVGPSEWESV